MSRRDNISANVGRLMASSKPGDASKEAYAHWLKWSVIRATQIEDAVDAAENARQDALNKANEAKRS